MNGLGPCRQVLAPATIAVLQGADASPPMCDWTDDSHLVAYLTLFTSAAPGMSVTVRAGVLWPREWSGDCHAEDSLCAEQQTLAVDIDFPCDRRDTAERELCGEPVALVQAPTEISSCPGTVLTLDGSRSSGGGIKPLTYRWYAHPTLCDNFYAIRPSLVAAGSASAVSLSGELDGGRNFSFLLRTATFLGRESEPSTVVVQRAAIPIPTITVGAPPLLRLRAGASVTVQAKATLASCFAGAFARVSFNWTSPHAAPLPGASLPGGADAIPSLALDARSSSLRDLQIAGSSLLAGVRYTLRVRGCMQAQPSVCGFADTDVALVDEPLRGAIAGGDRTVGEADGLTLSACASSGDPDDPAAQCDGAGACGTLRFAWSCVVAIASDQGGGSAEGGEASVQSRACEGVVAPASTACSWEIAPRTLSSGANYTFALSVSKPNGESSDSSVAVRVEEGTLPIVRITPLMALKQNPSRKMALMSTVTLPVADDDADAADADDDADDADGGGLDESSRNASATAGNGSLLDADDIVYTWSIEPEHADLASPNVSSTGPGRNNLVVLPHTLRAGAAYTVQLKASYQGRAASARVQVIMNRPPFGGSCVKSHASPVVALSTAISLEAMQWFDDPADLPLSYSFIALPAGGSGKDSLSLGQRSIMTSTVWQRAPAGQYLLFCDVRRRTHPLDSRRAHVTGASAAPSALDA